MSIHTRIDQPITVRKDLLECAIDCAEVLRSVENVKKIHSEKELVKKKLGVVMDKIRALDSRLRKDLPVLPREKKTTVSVEEPVVKVTAVKAAPKPRVKHTSEEDRTNKELETLRKKIESL